jgi:hypothetical protein
MPRVSFEDLRAHLALSHWCFTEPVNRIVYANAFEGANNDHLLDTEENVLLTLPGRHTEPDAPAIFQRV